jgi:hypothetical protein
VVCELVCEKLKGITIGNNWLRKNEGESAEMQKDKKTLEVHVVR